MRVPFRHFVVGLGFLVVGLVLGLAIALGMAPGFAMPVHVHLLLVGWICLTIMGAMTQFVPVWSGVDLHARSLAEAQLWLVAVGLVGLAATLLAARPGWALPFAAAMALGLWTFVYNVGRTLRSASSWGVTERRFAVALGFFLLLVPLGLLLVVDLFHPVLGPGTVPRGRLVATHATMAVFGAVLTTVLGALHQLSTMFTQAERHPVDVHLGRIEGLANPIGVILLAAGRAVASSSLARLGGLLVAAGLFGFGLLLARRLLASRVAWGPMVRRYAVATAAMVGWSVLAGAAWIQDPLARAAWFGAPGTTHLLVLGVIGFVVFGTLYHVVPFIIWVERYAHRLGFGPVPMIDDLYDGRLAAVDLTTLVVGTVVLVAADLDVVPRAGTAVGGGLVAVGAIVFATNLGLTIRRHAGGPTAPGGPADAAATDD